ncbi:MAG: site-2 protease family protein [Oscillospiraceae bacterium]|nr:site-2 protease family protein [Oscillospiraceae bacterium]
MNLFSMDKQQILMMLIARVIIILLILPLHEFAHAWAARRCGDNTAESRGRLTFNPLSHVDLVGAVLLLLTGFGWAKPVPVNPNRMNNPRMGMILTSLAGPASNLIFAFLAMIPFRILECIPIHSASMLHTLSIIYNILYFFILVNIGLAVFNLIPIPPLDGSNILMGFLPFKAIIWVQQHQRVISFAFLILILSDFLNTPLSFLQKLIFNGFNFLTNWVPLIVNGLTG